MYGLTKTHRMGYGDFAEKTPVRCDTFHEVTMDMKRTDGLVLNNRTALDDGKFESQLVGRIPFSSIPVVPDVVRSTTPVDPTELADTRSTNSKGTLVSGVASSTSIDHYGTEMSKRALELMGDQMEKGLPILPRHNNGNRAVEWDEVIGRTIAGRVIKTDVVNAASDLEQGHTLLLDSVLYDDEPLAMSLSRRLQRGENVGQSIGGWFLSVRVIEDGDGNVERMIVENVELDHVAITRAPANPDSVGLALRSSIDEALQGARVENNHLDGIQNRHIRKVEETEDTIIVTYGKSMEFEGVVVADHDDEMVEEMMDDEMAAHGDHDEEMSATEELSADSTEELDAHGDDEMSYHDDEEMDAHGDEEMSEDGTYAVRMITPFEDLPLAPEEMEWDWNTDAQNDVLGEDEDWDRYRMAHIFYDSDMGEVKAAYKLPIAMMVEGELHAVWRGVAAAMAALNGARGGVDIPADERDAAYEHLVRYYGKFDKEPPALRSESELSSDADVAQVERTCNNQLDTDSSVQHRADAAAGATNPTLDTEDEAMTKDDLDAIRAMITESVGGLTARIDAVETRTGVAGETKAEIPQAATEDKNDEVAILRDRLARTESALQALAARPTRVGRSVMPHVPEGTAAVDVFDGIADRAREDAPATSVVVTRHTKSLVERGDAGADRSDLVRMLTETLRAAEADGLLGNTNTVARWS